MKKLTLEDIQKISLYIPFRVMFEPLSCKTILASMCGFGFMGSTIIHSYSEDYGITESNDISNPKNDYRPILRLLETMTDEEFAMFEKLTMLHNVSKQEMADEILENNCKPDIFFYALSQHFDLFDLINAKKAIQKEKSWRYKER